MKSRAFSCLDPRSTSKEVQTAIAKARLIYRCLSKRMYNSRHEATIVARRRMRIKRKLKLRPYRCRDCDGWHLTSRKLVKE